MGGPGSGRWYRWQGSKTTVEECRRIDISDWHRRSLLHPGMRFSWNWWNGDGRPVASINVQVQQGRVLLFYRIRQQGGDWQEVEEHVFLTWTPCHYGGQRPWFVCPGGGCRQRVAKLYLGGGYFLCRSCLDLAHESQREDSATRLTSKAQKIRRRLGGSASLMDPFPPKPKGMHWHTYSQLFLKAQRAEEAGMTAELAQLERMSARSSMSTFQNQGGYGGNRL